MKKKRKYLTEDEISKLLKVGESDRHNVRNKLLIMMSFIHGFRVSELCNIRVSDLDMMSGILQIHRLKNGFSTIHPLLDEEHKQLSVWLIKRRAKLNVNNEWLFTSQKGEKLSRQRVYSIVREYGEMAGLPLNIHPHMFRHSCGYALANKGIDTRLIQDYLGHKNIAHTVIYTASNAKRFYGLWE